MQAIDLIKLEDEERTIHIPYLEIDIKIANSVKVTRAFRRVVPNYPTSRQNHAGVIALAC